MAEPKLGPIERLRGKRLKDIPLPNQSGMVDERLIEADLRSKNPLRKLRGVSRKGRNNIGRVSRR